MFNANEIAEFVSAKMDFISFDIKEDYGNSAVVEFTTKEKKKITKKLDWKYGDLTVKDTKGNATGMWYSHHSLRGFLS